MKIAVFYDSLMSKGGAEKVALDLARLFDADLITSGFSPAIIELSERNIKIIDIGNWTFNISKTFSYLVEIPLRFYFNKYRFKYDLYIYSGCSSIFSSRNSNNNIWYCHTPNRNLYDLKDQYIGNNFIKNLLINIYIKFLTYFDQKTVRKNIKTIVANSINGQKRIKKYYGRDSKKIYPGVDTNKLKFNRIGSFYLAVSRLYPIKRMDVIAKAFTNLSNEKLVIVGDGPEKDKILSIINGHTNISLKTNVPEIQLSKLYSDCKAVIYLPKDEDFGLVPVESNASGKLCILPNEGGCKETIINHKTGIFIKPDTHNIINVIRNLNLINLNIYKNRCIEQSQKFSLSNFNKSWKLLIQSHNYVI